MLQRMGTYWYAASFIYVVPAVSFLGFALCFYRTALYGPGEKPGLIRAEACVLLGFLAAWSQEQWFVTTVSFAVICLVYKFLRNRRLRIYDGLTFAACAAGGLIIILSPAVSARMNSEGNAAFASLSFFGKLGRNIPLLMNLFFSGDNLRYLLFFFPVMILLGLVMARQAGGPGKSRRGPSPGVFRDFGGGVCRLSDETEAVRVPAGKLFRGGGESFADIYCFLFCGSDIIL